MHVLTRALTVELGVPRRRRARSCGSRPGPRRNLGRAFDLACVAVLPLLFVDLGATVVVRALDVAVPGLVGLGLASVSFAWAGALVALAYRPAQDRDLGAPAAATGRAAAGAAGWGGAARGRGARAGGPGAVDRAQPRAAAADDPGRSGARVRAAVDRRGGGARRAGLARVAGRQGRRARLLGDLVQPVPQGDAEARRALAPAIPTSWCSR